MTSSCTSPQSLPHPHPHTGAVLSTELITLAKLNVLHRMEIFWIDCRKTFGKSNFRRFLSNSVVWKYSRNTLEIFWEMKTTGEYSGFDCYYHYNNYCNYNNKNNKNKNYYYYYYYILHLRSSCYLMPKFDLWT